MAKLTLVAARSTYVLAPLAEARIDQAYLLVRDVTPGLAIEQWRRYALHLIEAARDEHRRCGLHAAEAPAYFLRGLFSFFIAPDLHNGECLTIDYLAVPDALDRAAVAEALIAALHCLAVRLECAATRVRLGGHDRWLASKLAAAGFRETESCLTRRRTR